MKQRLIATLFIISPLIFFTGLPYPHALPRTILLSLLGCTALFFISRQKKYGEQVSYIALSAFAFLFFTLLTTAFHPDAARGILSSLERGTGVLILFAGAALYPFIKASFSNDETYTTQLTAYTLIVMSVIGFLQKMIPGFIETFSGARIGGTLGNAIFFGTYLTLSIMFMIMLWFQARKNLYLIAAGTGVIALILTATTGPLMGLVGGMIATIIIYYYTQHKKIISATLITLLILAGGAACIFRQPLLERLPTMQSRLVNWRIAWNGFEDHPYFGSGWESYHTAVSAHFDPALIRFGGAEAYPDKPHNAYLELLQSTGFVGTLLYLIWVGTLINSLYWLYISKKITAPLFASSTGFIIAYLIQNISAFETHGSLIPLITVSAWIGHHHVPLIEVRIAHTHKQLLIAGGAITFALATWIGIVQELPFMYALHTGDSMKLSSHLDSPYRNEYLSGITTKSSEIAALVRANFVVNTAWDSLLLAKYLATAALQTNSSSLFSDAETQINNAIATNPRRQELFVLQGQLMLARNNVEAADTALKLAIEIAPYAPEPHALRAVILIAQNKIADGWQELNTAHNNGLTTLPRASTIFITQKLLSAQESEKLKLLSEWFTER